jgi:hypothetical protein
MSPENVVYNINSELYEMSEDFCVENGIGLSFSTDGYASVIEFMGHVLWSTENDEREYIEETDDYEPLAPFVRRKFNELIANFVSLTLTNQG